MGPYCQGHKTSWGTETPIIRRVPVGRMDSRTHKVETKGGRPKVKYLGIK